MFSVPLPLHIGDSSVHYFKDRRPKAEIGKLKNIINSRGNSVVTAPFNKLITNAIGDDYVDPGKNFLRTGAGKKKIAGPFAPAGANKLVKHSEFVHMKEYNNRHSGSPLHSFK